MFSPDKMLREMNIISKAMTTSLKTKLMNLKHVESKTCIIEIYKYLLPNKISRVKFLLLKRKTNSNPIYKGLSRKLTIQTWSVVIIYFIFFKKKLRFKFQIVIYIILRLWFFINYFFYLEKRNLYFILIIKLNTRTLNN